MDLFAEGITSPADCSTIAAMDCISPRSGTIASPSRAMCGSPGPPCGGGRSPATGLRAAHLRCQTSEANSTTLRMHVRPGNRARLAPARLPDFMVAAGKLAGEELAIGPGAPEVAVFRAVRHFRAADWR